MKARKGQIDLAEEMERAKERAKQKTADVSLLKNDILRPWTINLSSSGLMRSETEKLDMVQTFTTPQKWAGIRGMSVLEAKPEGFDRIQQYVKKQVRMREEDYEPTPPLTGNRGGDTSDVLTAKTASKMSTGKRTTSSRLPSSQRSNPAAEGSADQSCSAVSMRRQLEDDEKATGIEYITRVQRSIYVNSMRSLRKQEAPLHTIKYVPIRPKPVAASTDFQRVGIGFRSPAKLAMMRKAATRDLKEGGMKLK